MTHQRDTPDFKPDKDADLTAIALAFCVLRNAGLLTAEIPQPKPACTCGRPPHPDFGEVHLINCAIMQWSERFVMQPDPFVRAYEISIGNERAREKDYEIGPQQRRAFRAGLAVGLAAKAVHMRDDK